MTNTKGVARLLSLISMSLLLAAGAARAEETPPLPTEFYEEVPQGEAPSIESYVHSESSISGITSDALNLCNTPAVPESSGTWLRRGWWSAEIDAIIWVRKWDRQNAIMGVDDTPSLRTLRLNRTSPTEASARLNLTRFLFRDANNRDHRFEFNVMGGGELVETCHLDSVDPNSISVPFTVDKAADASFDGASSMDITYASRLNSFELNYTVTSRMDRDRMELQPDGRWVRRANPGLTYHGLAGLRYLDLTENVFWTADDIINVSGPVAFTGENGLYKVETSNDLITFQVGGGCTYDADRWSLTFFTRGGLSLNDAKANALLSYTDPVTGDVRTDVGFNNSERMGSMPLVLQGGILGRYHLRPNVSIRAGYEFLYMTAMALAPHQVNFTPNDGKVGTTASPFMHGLTLGGEFYW